MSTLARAFLPDSALRRIRLALVRRNRRMIRNCEGAHAEVALQPVNCVEHYFHFIFDLLLPLWHLVETTPPTITFTLRPFGPFSNRLSPLFPNRVRIAEDADISPETPSQSLRGMNPQFVRLDGRELEAFRSYVLTQSCIKPAPIRDKLLVIERLPPDAYFKDQAIKKGAGASRRSIKNHDELLAVLRDTIDPRYSVENIQLENLSFRDQVKLFDKAVAVVAQHGAGLANCVWLRAGSTVCEITHDLSLMHFRHLSKAKGLNHLVHRVRHCHVRLDTDAVIRDMRADPHFGKLLKMDDS